MARQPVHPVSSCVKVSSYIRGYHAYQDVWQAALGEILLLQRYPRNVKDSPAVSVMKSNNMIVGHVPVNLSALFSHFLSRTCNKGTAEVIARINRGVGYG